jgi:hypothetical protein
MREKEIESTVVYTFDEELTAEGNTYYLFARLNEIVAFKTMLHFYFSSDGVVGRREKRLSTIIIFTFAHSRAYLSIFCLCLFPPAQIASCALLCELTCLADAMYAT